MEDIKFQGNRGIEVLVDTARIARNLIDAQAYREAQSRLDTLIIGLEQLYQNKAP